MRDTLFRDLFRYFCAGTAAAATHLGTLHILVAGGVDPVGGSAVGFCIATLAVNYPLQYFWTFRSARAHSSALPRYLAVTFAMLGVNTMLFWLLLSRTGLPPVVVQAAVILVIFIVNFVINRRITFASVSTGRASGDVRSQRSSA